MVTGKTHKRLIQALVVLLIISLAGNVINFRYIRNERQQRVERAIWITHNTFRNVYHTLELYLIYEQDILIERVLRDLVALEPSLGATAA